MPSLSERNADTGLLELADASTRSATTARAATDRRPIDLEPGRRGPLATRRAGEVAGALAGAGAGEVQVGGAAAVGGNEVENGAVAVVGFAGGDPQVPTSQRRRSGTAVVLCGGRRDVQIWRAEQHRMHIRSANVRPPTDFVCGGK
jgi:hypothetical protein